jgi:hypothetical protein
VGDTDYPCRLNRPRGGLLQGLGNWLGILVELWILGILNWGRSEKVGLRLLWFLVSQGWSGGGILRFTVFASGAKQSSGGKDGTDCLS